MRETEFVTGEVRIKWPRVFVPDEETKKYSVTCLLPKSNTAVKARIDAAIRAATQEGSIKHWKGTIPPNLPNPVWDGDGKTSKGEDYPEHCHGCWVFTASTDSKKFPAPRVVDKNLKPIDALRASEIYSGAYATVLINAYAYDSHGNRGIAFGLDSIQKLRDGEVITGARTSLAEAFGAPLQTDANGFVQAPQIDPFSGQALPF